MDMQELLDFLRSQGADVPDDANQIRRNLIFVVADTKKVADAKCVDLVKMVTQRKLYQSNGILAIHCSLSVDELLVILTKPNVVSGLPDFLTGSERKIFTGFGERATKLLTDLKSAFRDAPAAERKKLEVLRLEDAVPGANAMSPREADAAYLRAIVDLCNKYQG